MDTNEEKDTRAIVTDHGGKKYIGKIVKEVAPTLPEGFLLLEEAWAYLELDLPVPTPQGVAIQHMTHCRPTDGCSGPTSLYIKAATVHFLRMMTKEDRQRNEKMVEQVVRATAQTRAAEAGIQLVGAGALPQGSGRRGLQ